MVFLSKQFRLPRVACDGRLDLFESTAFYAWNMRMPSYGVDAAGRTLPLPPSAIRPVVPATRYTFSEISLVFTTGCLSVIVCILCTFQFITHLRHWRKPSLQKCYLRIVLLAPIYSCFSWFAVLSSRNSGVFDLCRSIYETYVLYTFFALMVYSVGGEVAVQRYLLQKSRQKFLARRSRCVLCPPCAQDGLLSWKLWTVESPETSLKFWKGCLWQFIVIKPTTAIVTSICEHRHVAIYWDPYIKPISLVSVTVAMCGLLNIYVNLCNHPSIRRLHAASKFLVVKAAIFLTVWQEVIFHILVGQGVIHSPYCYLVGKKSTHCLDLTGFATPSAQRGVRTVATLIIFEMFALSFAMLFYFSYADACLGRQGPQKSICFYDILTVLCFGDIFCDLEPEVCVPESRCKIAVESGLVRRPNELPQNLPLSPDIIQQYHAHAECENRAQK